MFDLIARLTMARVPEAPQRVKAEQLMTTAPPEPPNGQERVSIYVNPKALAFPILVGLIKGAWEAVKILPSSSLSPWLATSWFPFGCCIFLGLLIAVSNLTNEKPTILGWVLGLAVGCLNSLVVFGAVMGISLGKV